MNETVHEIKFNKETRRFPDGMTIFVGRDAQCSIQINDTGVSRVHAYLVFSRHGSYLGNGNPLTQKPSKNGIFMKGVFYRGLDIIPLRANEEFLIGSTTFFYKKLRMDTSKGKGDETIGLEDTTS
ncbi:MAG: FHA domain-containing protein [Coleofasciculus sp. G3-WIS-01]|uniref:FHA domain-containing protein n=1 Tax=Coleofasciculus sp. G3-WIS-01 TaxID=3069528 RepID=UPI0032F81F0E